MNTHTSLGYLAQVANLLNAIAPATIICLVAVALCRTAFKHNPSVRYFVCLVSLACILISPFIAFVSQKMGCRFTVIPLTRQSELDASSISDPSFSHSINANLVGSREKGTSFSTLFIQNGGKLIVFVWIAGIFVGGFRLIQGMRETLNIAQEACLWDPPMNAETRTDLERLAGGVLQKIYTSRRVFTPVAIGVISPMVIVPEGLAEKLTSTELRHVLLHECAHIAFKHTSGAVLQRAAKFFFWFHPLIGLTCRELARAREEVCDNVASQDIGAACYARTLLKISQGDFTAPNFASALSLLGPGTSLEARITGLLHPRRNRMIHMKKWMIWSTAGVALSALCLTTLVRVVAADTKSKASAQNPIALNNKPYPRIGTTVALDYRTLGEDLRRSSTLDATKSDMSEMLDATRLDESSEKISPKLSLNRVPLRSVGRTLSLDDKTSAEKKAHGKALSGTLYRSLSTGGAASNEHAAKLKAEAESLDKKPSTDRAVPEERLGTSGANALLDKLNAEASDKQK